MPFRYIYVYVCIYVCICMYVYLKLGFHFNNQTLSRQVCGYDCIFYNIGSIKGYLSYIAH